MATIISHEPATGAVLWQGEESDVDAEVAAVAGIWPQWAAQPLSVRVETVRRFANLVRGKEAELATLISRETGRPLWDSRGEVVAVIEGVEHAIAAYHERTGQKRLDGALGAQQAIRHKPHGIMAVITPYNAPAQVPAAHIVPALIAGNGVLFKPSHKAPATGELLTRLFHEAGVPPALLRCVIGGPAIGRALALHDQVSGILFTGSAHGGIALNRALASRPDKLLALQMGGNNAMILWDTLDIASAVAMVVQSAFPSSGQRCNAGRRLIVKDEMADLVIDELKRTVSRLIVDVPDADPAPYMGPVIDMDTADGLTESFLFLMSNGGKPITHMKRPKDGLPFVTPGVIDVTGMAERPDIELFGPILQIVRVGDFDTAVAEANATRFGMAAALFGGRQDHYDRFWSLSRAGTVNWNRPLGGWPGSGPVAGNDLSGNHRPGGTYTADHCAYPVVSSEIAQLRATIGVGLKAAEIVADR